MSREQLSLAVREAKRSDEKIHAPGKLGRVRIINQGIISGDLFGINLAFVARIPGLRTKRWKWKKIKWKRTILERIKYFHRIRGFGYGFVLSIISTRSNSTRYRYSFRILKSLWDFTLLAKNALVTRR